MPLGVALSVRIARVDKSRMGAGWDLIVRLRVRREVADIERRPQLAGAIVPRLRWRLPTHRYLSPICSGALLALPLSSMLLSA
jgi:hypothetical protein